MKDIGTIASRLRAISGVYAKDWLRYSRRIAAPGNAYLSICNRNETLESDSASKGQRCLWKWTSQLHAPIVLPQLGRKLMGRAMSDFPVHRAQAPARPSTSPPVVSFIIGHRGGARVPQLLATLQSIAAQQDAAVECIVVEQDVQQKVRSLLPSWVGYVHAPPIDSSVPYCRSAAFNTGVEHARGRLLVLHDNDMLVPARYAACLWAHFNDGYAVLNLKRFIFYLSKAHTCDYLAGKASLLDSPPESIVQNLEGGGSVAISRNGYARVGGMDESFVGWGGEDNEFWERAQTLRVWDFGYLPMIHLWHAPQPGKQAPDTAPVQRYREISAIPPENRIALLRQRNAAKAWAGSAQLTPSPGLSHAARQVT